MKLLRYGAAGKEKPGMLDKDGRIRDLSAVVADITGEAIGPKGLARLKKIKPESLPLVRGARGSAPASPTRRSSSPSASTIRTMRRNLAFRCRRSPSCSPSR
jgi:hypothetical protein